MNNASKHGLKNEKIYVFINLDLLHNKVQIIIKNKINPQSTKNNDIESKLFSIGISSDSSTNRWSSGDGGWIMKKCVETLDGNCGLVIRNDEAVFTLEFPTCFEKMVELNVDLSKWYFIILDDSFVQRKLFSRIFNSEKWKIENKNSFIRNHKIFGECSNNITKDIIMHTHEITHIFNNFVLIFDKNLDYGNTFECGLHIGKQIKEYFKNTYKNINIKLIMRTANDSKDDLEYYTKNTDGYILKNYIKTDSFIQMMKEKLVE
jgi:hypothetical protein